MFKSEFSCRLLIHLVIPLVIITGLSSCRYFRERGVFNGREIKMAIIKAREDSIRHADSISRLNSGIIMTGKDSSIVLPDNIKEPVANEDASAKIGSKAPVSKPVVKDVIVSNEKYCIIVGTFTMLENANERKAEYDRKGYKTGLINAVNRNGKNVILVAVVSEDDSVKSEDLLATIREKEDSSAWLYTKK
jgi:hypothetical protein